MSRVSEFEANRAAFLLAAERLVHALEWEIFAEADKCVVAARKQRACAQLKLVVERQQVTRAAI